MIISGNYQDSPILAELYDLVPDYIARPDTGFYIECAAAATGRVLELACGTGRVLIPIAESGCDITGLDLSEHMLAQCRRKLELKVENIRDRVELVQGNMTSFSLDKVFDLTIIPFRAFLHLITVSDQLSCLTNINRHLAMNAKLIFDVFQVDSTRINNPRFLNEQVDFPDRVLPDGRKLRRNHRIVAFHSAEQYSEVELIYYLTDIDGSTERIVHAFPIRYIYRYEMEHLLARCGFKIVAIYGNFDKSPLCDDSPEMIFVAEKQSELK